MLRLMIGLACVGFGAGVVRAQPIIIPLEHQAKQPTPGQAIVSAPPVAPPQAGPSLPATTDTAIGASTISPQEETAAARR